ncbi:hypothetical protein CJ030_MR7G005498 [Morella rubra]|uniref:SWIM-type domain-containing protein n=1 Tax=Morella rubra TaxID=262757 RepID=A0A6A1V962_9ROSI|nr:hypothetical protein CJ030_MR7G005498 [Morella rubra]
MKLLKVFIHHGGSFGGEPLDYVGGTKEEVGDMDPDYITILDFNACLSDRGYFGSATLWYKLGGKSPHQQFTSLKTDGDVIDLLWRLESEDAQVIDVYVEHSVDVPTLVSEQDVIDFIRSQCPTEDSDEGVMGAKDSGQHGDSCNEVANDVGNKGGYEGGIEAGFEGDNGGDNEAVGFEGENTKRSGAATATTQWCPKILKKLETNKDLARNYICHWKSVGKFEVDHYFEARRVVDMTEKTCTCGRWQLNGIPCAHAVAAIYFDKQNPEDFIHRCYHMDTFREAYRFPIESMLGPDEWPKDDDNTILPPQYRRQPGRPRVARRRGLDEPDETYKVTRQGTCPKKKAQQTLGDVGTSQPEVDPPCPTPPHPPMELVVAQPLVGHTQCAANRPRKKMTPFVVHSYGAEFQWLNVDDVNTYGIELGML